MMCGMSKDDECPCRNAYTQARARALQGSHTHWCMSRRIRRQCVCMVLHAHMQVGQTHEAPELWSNKRSKIMERHRPWRLYALMSSRTTLTSHLTQ
eukprot:1157540-Pelagomonas_calceolata.AAC.19